MAAHITQDPVGLGGAASGPAGQLVDARERFEQPPQAAPALTKIREEFREHLYLPDAIVIDFVASVIVANRLAVHHGNDPLWGMVIAPSGATKTEAVGSAAGVPEVYSLSTLTEKTLLSGKVVQGRSMALLHRLDGLHKTLIAMKDFTTVLSERPEVRTRIFGDLREVYDGSITRDTGMGATIRWQGKMGLLAGVTPAVDLYSSDLGVLGERFIYLRLPASDGAAQKRLAAASLDGDEEEDMRVALRRAMAEFVEQVELHRLKLPPDVKSTLIQLSRRTAILRTPVARDRWGSRDILIRPTPEAPTRLAKQLRQLWRAAILIGHEDPMALVTRVAMDSSGPSDRTDVLRLAYRAGTITVNDAVEAVSVSKPTARRLLEDLHALKMLDVVQWGSQSAGMPTIYCPSALLHELVNPEGGVTQNHPQREEREI